MSKEDKKVYIIYLTLLILVLTLGMLTNVC
mgnify:CR=1 FL=1|jgi:hypothetical protein